MINGERVKQVRELRGLTQTELAQSIGVTQSEIAHIEAGTVTPSDEILQQVAFKTQFPLPFFKQRTSIDFPLGSLLYRAKSNVTLKKRREAHQFARIIFEVIDRLEKHKSVNSQIPLRLPRLNNVSIEDAAAQTRAAFGLWPDIPVENLINTIEKNGVLVIALPVDIEGIDAFSTWVGDTKVRPVIVLTNSKTPGDRLRFSVSHEVGHLVAHYNVNYSLSEIDKEADVFASHFLTPADAIKSDMERPVTLLGLMQLKSKWKVSVQSLIRRAYDLQLVNQRQYHYLMYQLSSRYGRMKEPVDIKIEKPRFFGQLAEIVYGVPVDYKSLASHMYLPARLVRDTVEVHAIKAPLVSASQTETDNKVFDFPHKQ
jgi:Zn-dependent peptidase ImmA (M78 family)/DNA-binding XRE family transcriptional regulator